MCEVFHIVPADYRIVAPVTLGEYDGDGSCLDDEAVDEWFGVALDNVRTLAQC